MMMRMRMRMRKTTHAKGNGERIRHKQVSERRSEYSTTYRVRGKVWSRGMGQDDDGDGRNEEEEMMKRMKMETLPLITSMEKKKKKKKQETEEEERKYVILISGGGGKMAQAAATCALERGHRMYPYAPSGPSSGGRQVSLPGSSAPLHLVTPSEHKKCLCDAAENYRNRLLVLDYSLPTAVEDNVKLYCELNLPFVLGATGGDRAKLAAIAEASKTKCVIAPQMGKQLVALQAMLDAASRDFPGAFQGYTLRAVESHQATKKDTSGTAIKMTAALEALGAAFESGDAIKSVRDRDTQLAMGVPENALDSGHAFHTYEMISPGGDVKFTIGHDVCGRHVYAEGSVDAIEFLASMAVHADAPGGEDDKVVFSMEDVLRAGAMC